MVLRRVLLTCHSLARRVAVLEPRLGRRKRHVGELRAVVGRRAATEAALATALRDRALAAEALHDELASARRGEEERRLKGRDFAAAAERRHEQAYVRAFVS